MAPMPATSNIVLLKSKFSKGKGWKNRMKRKIPRLIFNNKLNLSLIRFSIRMMFLFFPEAKLPVYENNIHIKVI